MKAISQDVLAVLSAAEVEGSELRLVGQLDRKLYTDVNKVLVALGGKWNRSAKAHIFSGDAGDLVDEVILSGGYVDNKQDFGQFDTPVALAEEVVTRGNVADGMTVLEPSAGLGRIANAAREAFATVECFELDQARAQQLVDAGHKVEQGDFLEVEADARFDRVLMNPPFSKSADIKHVRHAFDFLKPGGRLVAIMSPGFTYRQNRSHVEFREWVEAQGGIVEPLPEGAFRESGTGVQTVMVVIDR